MKNRKQLIAMLLIIAMAFAVYGCAPNESSNQPTDKPSESTATPNATDDVETSEMSASMKKIKDSGEIVWGTNAAFPPFEMRVGDDVIGVDAEIAAKIAEKLGVELKVVDQEFDTLPNSLTANQIDFIAAGYTIKPDREEQMLFTDTYFEAVQMIIVQEGNEEIKVAADLEGKTIGVQAGTTGDFTAEEYTEDIYRFNNALEAAIDLKNGRLDAVIIDNLPAQIIVAQNEGLIMLEEKAADDEAYALGVRKDATDLLEVINEVIAELKASGQIAEWVEEYSGTE